MTRSAQHQPLVALPQWRWWPKEEETIRQVFASGTGLVGTSSSTAFLHCVNLCFKIYFLFVGSTFPLALLQLHMTRLELGISLQSNSLVLLRLNFVKSVKSFEPKQLLFHATL